MVHSGATCTFSSAFCLFQLEIWNLVCRLGFGIHKISFITFFSNFKPRCTKVRPALPKENLIEGLHLKWLLGGDQDLSFSNPIMKCAVQAIIFFTSISENQSSKIPDRNTYLSYKKILKKLSWSIIETSKSAQKFTIYDLSVSLNLCKTLKKIPFKAWLIFTLSMP